MKGEPRDENTLDDFLSEEPIDKKTMDEFYKCGVAYSVRKILGDHIRAHTVNKRYTGDLCHMQQYIQIDEYIKKQEGEKDKGTTPQ